MTVPTSTPEEAMKKILDAEQAKIKKQADDELLKYKSLYVEVDLTAPVALVPATLLPVNPALTPTTPGAVPKVNK